MTEHNDEANAAWVAGVDSIGVYRVPAHRLPAPEPDPADRWIDRRYR